MHSLSTIRRLNAKAAEALAEPKASWELWEVYQEDDKITFLAWTPDQEPDTDAPAVKLVLTVNESIDLIDAFQDVVDRMRVDQ